ncbi:MAG: NnrS family protein [Burkholderiaceae bacterium]|nr:NnrS family protein [Burkholderiaceae bacterium]
MAGFIPIEEPHRAPPRGFALWQLGFRPFYLLASVFASLSIALWAAQTAGWIRPLLPSPLRHAHEMVFGYTLAVIVGFLFTAGRNWTNRPTPTGAALAALAGWWLAGRVLVLTPYASAAAIVNATFPLAAAVALAIPFWAARNRRNYFFVALLVLLALANAAIHAANAGVLTLPGALGVQVALDVVIFVMAVMGGRVIPMFTNNGVPGAGALRDVRVERAALGSVLVLLAADALQVRAAAMAAVLAFAALAHGARLALWHPWRTRRTPLVWSLHVAYAWIVVHLLLRALAEFGLVVPTLATHALTVGAIGGLTMAMMTRTARGHTARPLRADRADVACYTLVLLAALVRVVVPLVAPGAWLAAVVASAAAWSAAFGLYALHYGPWLIRPRLDGAPG